MCAAIFVTPVPSRRLPAFWALVYAVGGASAWILMTLTRTTLCGRWKVPMSGVKLDEEVAGIVVKDEVLRM